MRGSVARRCGQNRGLIGASPVRGAGLQRTWLRGVVRTVSKTGSPPVERMNMWPNLPPVARRSYRPCSHLQWSGRRRRRQGQVSPPEQTILRACVLRCSGLIFNARFASGQHAACDPGRQATPHRPGPVSQPRDPQAPVARRSDQGRYSVGSWLFMPRRTSKCRKDGSPARTWPIVWPRVTLASFLTVRLSRWV